MSLWKVVARIKGASGEHADWYETPTASGAKRIWRSEAKELGYGPSDIEALRVEKAFIAPSSERMGGLERLGERRRNPSWEEQALAHRKKYESFEERCMRPSRKRKVRNPRRNSKACKIVRFKYRAGRRHRLMGGGPAPSRKSGLAKWLLPVAGLAAAYFFFIRKG